MNIAALIDHTLLKPEASAADIARLCQEAVQFGFGAVCVSPFYVPQAARQLHGSAVTVASVAGFPLGFSHPRVKSLESRIAIDQGATEIDMVLNIAALKNGEDDHVADDVAAVAELCRDHDARCKVILETCLLTEPEKIKACELCVRAKAHYVKTSTGLSTGGATVADVALLSRLVSPHGLGVKAAGGIRSLADLQSMVAAGATRIGTSAGVKIIQELHTR